MDETATPIPGQSDDTAHPGPAGSDPAGASSADASSAGSDPADASSAGSGPAGAGSYQQPQQDPYQQRQAPDQPQAGQYPPSGGYQQPGGGAPHARTSPLRSFFTSVRRTGLLRCEERWVAGVAGGLARRLGLDPVLVRCVWLVTLVVSGLGLVLYGLAWALLPEERDGRIHLEQATVGDIAAGFAGAIVAVITGVGMGQKGLFPAWFVLGWTSSSAGRALTMLLWAGLILLILWAATRGSLTGGASQPAGTYPGGMHTGGTYPNGPQPAGTTPGRTQVPGDPSQPTTAWAAPAMTGSGLPPHPAQAPLASPSPAWQTPTPVAPRRPRTPGPGRTLSLTVLALILLSLAASAIATTTAHLSALNALVIGAGLLVTILGLGVIISAARGRRGGWMSVCGVLTLILAGPVLLVGSVVGSVGALNDSTPEQEVNIAVTDAMVQGSAGHLDLGTYAAANVNIDLRGLSAKAARGATITIEVGVGSVRVLAQQGQAVTVDAEVGVGGATTGSGPWPWSSTGVRWSQQPHMDWAQSYTVTGEKLQDASVQRGGVGIDTTLATAQGSAAADALTVDVEIGAGAVRLEERKDEVTWSGWKRTAYWVVDSWQEPDGTIHGGHELPVPGMTFPAASVDDVWACTERVTGHFAPDGTDDWPDGPDSLDHMAHDVGATVDACVLERIGARTGQVPPGVTPTPSSTPSPTAEEPTALATDAATPAPTATP